MVRKFVYLGIVLQAVSPDFLPEDQMIEQKFVSTRDENFFRNKGQAKDCRSGEKSG